MTHVQKFSRLSNKVEVWVSVFDFFKMECNLLQDLFNTGFVLWWRTLGSEIMQIPDFFLKRWRCCLIKEPCLADV